MKKNWIIAGMVILVLAAGILGWRLLVPGLSPVPRPGGAGPGQTGSPTPAPGTEFESEAVLRSFLDPARDQWQHPQEVIRAMGLRPGQTIADLGAASGYFTYHFSRAVGPKGIAWAVDIDANAISFLRNRLEREPPPYANIRPVLSRPDDITLKADSLDYGFLCEAHFFLDPDSPPALPCLRSLYAAIKPGGKVAVLEFRENHDLGPVAPALIEAPFRSVGFRLLAVHEFLPREHLLIFEKPAGGSFTGRESSRGKESGHPDLASLAGRPSQEVLISYLDPNRDSYQQPQRVLEALGLRPGESVADVGAGSGYFTYHLSQAVGPQGTVWAVDVDPNAVHFLRRRLLEDPPPYSNVRMVASKDNDVGLAPASLDRALLCEAHFFLEYTLHREALSCLQSLYRALKPGGTVAVLEFKDNLKIGKISLEQVEKPFWLTGFQVQARYTFLKSEHCVVFVKPANAGGTSAPATGRS